MSRYRTLLPYAHGFYSAQQAAGADISAAHLDALEVLAASCPRPLVEGRCGRRGCQLFAVHSTRRGALFWTVPQMKRLSPGAARQAAPALDGWSGDPRRLPLAMCRVAFLNDLAQAAPDHCWCRCGMTEVNFAAVRDAAEEARHTGRTVLIT